MPERVTREERKISMAIQKARDAKEILYHSLMDNNRSPMDDESEHVKLKRPKAENYTYKGESNDGPTTLHAYAGEITKMFSFMKSMGDFTWGNKIVNTDKHADYLLNELQEFIMGDEKSQRIFLRNLHQAADDYKRTLQKAVRESDYRTNPMLDDEARRTLIMMIDETESAMEVLRAEVEGMKEKGAKLNDLDNVKSLLATLGVKASKLEQRLQKIPEQTAYYNSEASDTTLDDNF